MGILTRQYHKTAQIKRILCTDLQLRAQLWSFTTFPNIAVCIPIHAITLKINDFFYRTRLSMAERK